MPLWSSLLAFCRLSARYRRFDLYVSQLWLWQLWENCLLHCFLISFVVVKPIERCTWLANKASKDLWPWWLWPQLPQCDFLPNWCPRKSACQSNHSVWNCSYREPISDVWCCSLGNGRWHHRRASSDWRGPNWSCSLWSLDWKCSCNIHSLSCHRSPQW